jgi:hypothetical protein
VREGKIEEERRGRKREREGYRISNLTARRAEGWVAEYPT